MLKITTENLTYYYRMREHMIKAMSKVGPDDTSFNALELATYADTIIDTDTQTIVKSRLPVNEIMDRAYQ